MKKAEKNALLVMAGLSLERAHGREAPGPPVVNIPADSDMVIGRAAIGRRGGHHGGHGGHRGGHHGRRGHGGRRGGGPWPWGFVLDERPAVYLDSREECEDGKTLYTPSGEPVCPGDPRYPALAQAFARIHAAGAIASAAIGDLGCSGIDLDEWKLKNRIRMFPEKRHFWLLERAVDDNATMQTVRQEAEGSFGTATVFQKWFSEVGVLPGDLTETIGKVDNLKVLSVGPFADVVDVARKMKLAILDDGSELPTRPSVKEPKAYALVEFIYRGTTDSMPWPVYNDATFSRKWCPVDARWTLHTAFVPSDTNVPKETRIDNPSTYTPLPSSEEIERAAKAAKEGAGDIAKAILFAGAGLLAIAVMSKKS